MKATEGLCKIDIAFNVLHLALRVYGTIRAKRIKRNPLSSLKAVDNCSCRDE